AFPCPAIAIATGPPPNGPGPPFRRAGPPDPWPRARGGWMLARMTVARTDRSLEAASVSGALRRIRVFEVLRRIRRSGYVVVGTSARFRAEQRRRTVVAARAGFLLIAAPTFLDAVLVLDRQPEQIPVIVS